jgi:hypothetical protein
VIGPRVPLVGDNLYVEYKITGDFDSVSVEAYHLRVFQ